jgi:cAMP phosphodiesterase
MRVRILTHVPGDAIQYLTSYLVDDRVAIDAGCIGLYGGPEDQGQIDHVFLSHTHADHIFSLPFFLQNACQENGRIVAVHGHEHVLRSVRTDMFNDRLWPQYLIEEGPGSSCVRLETLEPETPVSVTGLSVTPVLVDHIVPTFGFIVEDGTSAVAFGSDSGPTERIWEIARGLVNLKGVFMETSFPDGMRDLARSSGHMTPRMVREEVTKLPEGVPVIAVHLCPRHRARIVEELNALELPNLSVGVGDREYTF